MSHIFFIKRVLPFILLIVAPYSLIGQEKAGIKYDIDCYQIPATSLDVLTKMGTGILESFGESVSVSDQEELGEEVLEFFKDHATLDNSPSQKKRLKSILYNLVRNIRDPKGFNYEIFYMDTSIINAFTVGGKIFVTKAMIEFCDNNDELACIIGHEIAHNELGHLERSIKKQKLVTNVFGESSSFATAVINFFTDPFGQLDEAYCDMRGMDIAIASGYQACPFKNLWERMEQENGTSDALTTFLSTHPNSGSRAKCVGNHMLKNYQVRCQN
jgi:predicted Zn-dependent protease